MKKTTKFLIHFLVLILLVLPALSFAAEPTGLVECKTNCGFNELMALINKVIKFILFQLALPIAAIMFAYAGILLVTSGGSTEARSKAKGIFLNTLIGLVIAVAAWLIINTLLAILGYDGGWIGFKKPTP